MCLEGSCFPKGRREEALGSQVLCQSERLERVTCVTARGPREQGQKHQGQEGTFILFGCSPVLTAVACLAMHCSLEPLLARRSIHLSAVCSLVSIALLLSACARDGGEGIVGWEHCLFCC